MVVPLVVVVVRKAVNGPPPPGTPIAAFARSPRMVELRKKGGGCDAGGSLMAPTQSRLHPRLFSLSRRARAGSPLFPFLCSPPCPLIQKPSYSLGPSID